MQRISMENPSLNYDINDIATDIETEPKKSK